MGYRDHIVNVRLTAEEKAQAQEWAHRNGLSLSDYIRRQITEPDAPAIVITSTDGQTAAVRWSRR